MSKHRLWRSTAKATSKRSSPWREPAAEGAVAAENQNLERHRHVLSRLARPPLMMNPGFKANAARHRTVRMPRR
jgi:hypothetical protein